MNRNTLRQVANILALAGALLVNFMANALPLNGQTSAEIANRLPIFFVPANYVFSIWGVIYTFLIAFAAYQAMPSQRENPYLKRIGYWFVLSCMMNATWLFLFHYNQFALSMVAMIVLLISLIVIYTRLDIGASHVSSKDRWLICIPFSIYLGWITVATVANAAYVLYDANWSGFGISGEVWAAIMLVVATTITLAIIVRHADIVYSGVMVWAFVGIVVKQSSSPLVAVTAAIMTGVVILAAASRIRLTNRLQGQRRTLHA